MYFVYVFLVYDHAKSFPNFTDTSIKCHHKGKKYTINEIRDAFDFKHYKKHHLGLMYW